MSESTSGAEQRRLRIQCYLAAAIFAGCGVALAVLPLDISGVARVVLAGVNLVAALGVGIYGRRLKDAG